MSISLDVVKFELGGEFYALDIQLAREIVEMIPITTVPRAPPSVAGLINLRGEITTIVNLAPLLGVGTEKDRKNQKIIVLMPDAASGANAGIIVDDVSSVISVAENDVEMMANTGLTSDSSSFVKGIIKSGEGNGDQKELIIWLDIAGILRDTL
jgi:purine-binding chemotaxis protein CheW